jgi:hypothetical protein
MMKLKAPDKTVTISAPQQYPGHAAAWGSCGGEPRAGGLQFGAAACPARRANPIERVLLEYRRAIQTEIAALKAAVGGRIAAREMSDSNTES